MFQSSSYSVPVQNFIEVGSVFNYDVNEKKNFLIYNFSNFLVLFNVICTLSNHFSKTNNSNKIFHDKKTVFLHVKIHILCRHISIIKKNVNYTVCLPKLTLHTFKDQNNISFFVSNLEGTVPNKNKLLRK